MAVLNRDQILKVNDLPSETVPVPEWGGEVIVRALTGTERDAFEASMIQLRGKEKVLKMENIRARLAALSVVDEQGIRLFTDADVEQLGHKSATALNRVFEVAQRLSGLTPEAVEELTGNSLPGQSEGSTSA